MVIIFKMKTIYLFGVFCAFFISTTETDVACMPNCADNPLHQTDLACNETTGECLFGCKGNFDGDTCESCKRSWTGDQCQLECDYNCRICTWDRLTNKTDCKRCLPEFYYNENSKKCEKCDLHCFNNSDSALPTCDETDGRCNFGCKPGFHGSKCNKECSLRCVNKSCDAGGCCNEGCRLDTHGGCRCNEECHRNCVDGKCNQDKACKECPVNRWGSECNQTCSENCREVDVSAASCNISGTCILGCKRTFKGPRCSESCSGNCVDKNCDPVSGVCLGGCIKGYYGPLCERNCSTNCVDSNCFNNNGSCIVGCVPGFYGPFCSISCPSQCLNSMCDRGNGTCIHGCLVGFTGKYCTDLKHPAVPRPVLNYQFLGISSGALIFALVFLAIAAYLLKKRK